MTQSHTKKNIFSGLGSDNVLTGLTGDHVFRVAIYEPGTHLPLSRQIFTITLKKPNNSGFTANVNADHAYPTVNYKIH